VNTIPRNRGVSRQLCDELLRNGRLETVSNLSIEQLRIAYLAESDRSYRAISDGLVATILY